ncbi:hypothetical protein SASPL_111792 [Salvia splendens]|uniref:Heat shock protein DnaJ, cysteine-rich domain-containing protein n=1 Tax=Salvia splendens TaxID=180675 RepID=A0A8X8YD47_SALSN|nr:uncharacterized protein LOC121799202 [Salvia splendens]KAG6427546.1 hypothetical protein SASPL_111792 [Salvia splendens]
MASVAQFHALFVPSNSIKKSSLFFGSTISLRREMQKSRERKQLAVVAAVGDVSADGTVYLIAGAAAVALLGTAFPIIFSRKDTCPECDGAGFVRKGGAALRANAARKDQTQIVCARCNGLGKLNQVDK